MSIIANKILSNMEQLTFTSPNGFYINSRKDFAGQSIAEKDISNAFYFSYQMAFGNGHHRSYRSGGQHNRSKGEIFCNTFQGKLAEIALQNELIKRKIECAPVDLRVMGKSEWDDCDLTAEGKLINIKSAAYFSNLLLLEKNDWDENGLYQANKNNEQPALYDYFALVRIGPDIKTLLKSQRLLYCNSIRLNNLHYLISKENWLFDIPGFVTQDELVNQVIENDQLLPQNSLLSGKTKMDASNYYIQAGDLHSINDLELALNKSKKIDRVYAEY